MRIALLAGSCLLGLSFVSCGDTTSAVSAAPATAEDSFMAHVDCVKGNDVAGLLALAPADKLAEMRKAWESRPPMRDEEKAQMNMALNMALAPTGVDDIMAMAKPQLEQMNLEEMSQGVAFLGMMLGGSDLSEAEKTDMSEVLQGVTEWVKTSGLNDEVKCRQTLEHVVAGLKESGIKTADDLNALTFDQVLEKSGIALRVVKETTAVYGVNVDEFLGSFAAKAGAEDGAVDVSFKAFGKDRSFSVPMLKVGDQWVIDKQEKEAVAPVAAPAE